MPIPEGTTHVDYTVNGPALCPAKNENLLFSSETTPPFLVSSFFKNPIIIVIT